MLNTTAGHKCDKMGIEGLEVLKKDFVSHQNVLSEAKQSLVNIARDQNQYPKILEGLIAQVSHRNTAWCRLGDACFS